MNGDLPMDMGEIERNIAAADIIAIYFPFLAKTLLVDTRYDESEGPMVKLVPVARSIQDRMETIRELRPRFPKPQSVAVVPWPKYVRTLEQSGIWDRIVKRLGDMQFFNQVNECRKIFGELEQMEQKEIVAAVTGEGFRTLWAANDD
jgi:hypothetical protein